jgi:hypothetical protein
MLCIDSIHGFAVIGDARVQIHQLKSQNIFFIVSSYARTPPKFRGRFCIVWAMGLEGESVQSGLPVDVRDRGRPVAQSARESSPAFFVLFINFY